MAARPLALGLTEFNPNLVWSAAARPVLPPGFAPWRDVVSSLKPQYDRVFVFWSQIQPLASQPADLEKPQDGCVRGIAPCGAFRGLREQFAAIRSQQRVVGGWQPVIVIDGVPAWAARGPSGCERNAASSSSRPITDVGIAAYRALIAEILALGRAEGIALPFWAPWNEPDHPAFISPQRALCSVFSQAVSPLVYAQLARAAHRELAADPEPHRLVLGELAGFARPSPYATTAAEFVSALPDDVACASDIWSVHAYARPVAVRGGSDPVVALEQALDARPCTRGARIWVDETGAGNIHGNGEPSRMTACATLANDLARWSADARIDAAFQYTVRDDPYFPVGLLDAQLTHAWPSLGVWSALGAGRLPVAGDCSSGTAH